VLLSAWDRSPRSFVISRAVRLYPAYWIAVTLTTIVSFGLSRGRFPVSLPQYLANLTMFNSLPNIQNTQFAHYFIAGMALCLIHRYGASPQTLLIVAISLGNAIYRASVSRTGSACATTPRSTGQP
jgi:peptidoglycan/LPS O-acetylase OafA/YrhL